MINIGYVEGNDFERRQVVGVVADVCWLARSSIGAGTVFY